MLHTPVPSKLLMQELATVKESRKQLTTFKLPKKQNTQSMTSHNTRLLKTSQCCKMLWLYAIFRYRHSSVLTTGIKPDVCVKHHAFDRVTAKNNRWTCYARGICIPKYTIHKLKVTGKVKDGVPNDKTNRKTDP